jgi:dolichol-phosphate mannosyltransferase
LSIVVPTFNEQANIPILVERLAQLLAGCEWEVIFVDDNSPDGTSATDQEKCQRVITSQR